LTNGKGVDHVVEVGGSGTMEQSVACTKRGGVVSSVGFLAEGKKSDLVGPLLYGAKTCELFPYCSSFSSLSFPLCGTREGFERTC
jgi:NADPH:quinone reductase-like Zn-dependent oxidoreductase